MREIFKGKRAPLYLGLGILYAFGLSVLIFTSPKERQWQTFLDACLTPLGLFAFFAVCSMIALAVHELGHLFAGRLAGFPWLAITVGPVSFVRTSKGIKVRWSGFKSLSGLAQCHIQAHGRFRERLGLFVLGGPIASLVMLLLSISVFRASGGLDSFLEATSPQRWLPLIFFASALSPTIGSLLPFGIRGMDTDAVILWRLLRGGPKGERQVALAMLGAKASAGLRFREWEPDLLEIALKPRDLTPARLQALFLNYLHEVDQGNFEKAKPLIEEAALIEPKIHEVYLKLKRAVRTEEAFLHAAIGEPASAQRMVERLGRADKEGLIHRKRVLAAIAFADGDFEEGKRLQSEYANELRSQPQIFSRTLIEAEIEWLEWVEARYQRVPRADLAAATK